MLPKSWREMIEQKEKFYLYKDTILTDHEGLSRGGSRDAHGGLLNSGHATRREEAFK